MWPNLLGPDPASTEKTSIPSSRHSLITYLQKEILSFGENEQQREGGVCLGYGLEGERSKRQDKEAALSSCGLDTLGLEGRMMEEKIRRLCAKLDVRTRT